MTSSSSVTLSTVRADDILCSGNDGVYDVSFFAASIRHSIELSRAVFSKLTGSLAGHRDLWAELGEHERQAYLLEHHEFAHHALMFSTPVGVLNWRINQVISRDVQWVLKTCHEYGEDLPVDLPPQSRLSTREWRTGFKRRSDVPRPVKKELLRTLAGLDDLVQLRRILFEPGAAASFPDLTFGDLLALFGRAHPYLQHRCDARFCLDWRTKLPLNTKVFPPDKAFNVVNIAETHAIAMELFVLRAVGDLEGLRRRLDSARQGPHAQALNIAVEATSGVNDLGLSPHQMQLLALIACSTTVDIAPPGSKTQYLEEVLPWWRFTAAEPFEAGHYLDALKNCMAISTESLVGPGSQWLQLSEYAPPEPNEVSLASVTALLKSLGSLGLDRQIHAIHHGAGLNWRYLATQLEVSLEERLPFAFERLAPGEWRGELQAAVLLVEYKDGVHFRHADFAELYPPGSPYRAHKSLDRFADPAYQILAQVLNGVLPRVMFAAYAGRLLPRLQVLEPKLAEYFANAGSAASTIKLLTMLLEGELSVASPFLTFAPADLVERYI